MTNVDTRTIEKLIALLSYEFSYEAKGCGSAETLEELLIHVREVLLNDDCPADPTEEDLERIHRNNITMGEYLLRGMIAAGHLAAAESFVEGIADQRRQCHARFNVERSIPFSPEERDQLAAAWGASRTADASRDVECVA